MWKTGVRWLGVVGVLMMVALVAGFQSAWACGGLFCTTSPVDQNAERIIFTQNADGTVSAIIQIQYTGFSEDFSWVLPLPSAITADDIEVPDTATSAFLEIESITNPVFIPPPIPEDCMIAMPDMAVAEEEGAGGGVTVFASGEVGPYGFDVVGSEDPQAMINWLRDNEYQVTQAMEPLIDVYVQEGMAFLAMRLRPDQGVQDIQPIKVTYDTDLPMIPLRLTAVAAQPDMRVLVWFYSEAQAIPTNYAAMNIDDSEITFTTFGGNNYRQLLGDRANEFNGQAFITEYAGPTSELAVGDPLLIELQQEFGYVTRLSTVISPEEMTVDPTFDYDAQMQNVSNMHDLSDRTGVYTDCPDTTDPIIDVPEIVENVIPGNNEQPEQTESGDEDGAGLSPLLIVNIVGWFLLLTIVGIVAVVMIRRGRRGS